MSFGFSKGPICFYVASLMFFQVVLLLGFSMVFRVFTVWEGGNNIFQEKASLQ